MKRLALMAACLLLAGPAWAQPQEIESEGVIQLSVGGAIGFEFPESTEGGIFFAPNNDTLQIIPQTDRSFAVGALKPGTARMFVRNMAGKLIYNVDIIVAPEPGRIVKIYGGNKNDDLNAGYTATYCTEHGCERPDKDLPKPTSVTIERFSGFRKGQ